MPLVFSVLAAAVVGAMLQGVFGLLFGGLVGCGIGLVLQQREQLAELRRQVDRLVVADETGSGVSRPETRTEADSVEAAGQAAPVPGTEANQSAEPAALGPSPAQPSPANASFGPGRRREPTGAEKFFDDAVRVVRNFFTTGNLVVRIGVVVLFFGIAFALRFAYDNALLPVELRLAAAGLAGMVLVAVGWRLRHRADTYGLVLQGAGVGILYLTIFAAARLYNMVPVSAALMFLVVLVVASSILAVVQKSQSLAIFSMSGGFLAPVLMSTGTGNHVALFSYYAVLNAGILAMAWYQHWRWLNWVGFVFTFAIGSVWGYQYYRPELFASTEPFLLLFFAYYVGVCVLFARRREVELHGVVDGTLVFGTPIIAFGLQAALVQDLPFGLAFSALGAAVTYIALALWLKRKATFSDLLGSSFVALGVVFATLAIPFAFDDQRYTAASWALEGAGLIWVGLRQQQRLPRAFGVLLQLAAAVAFLSEIGSSTATMRFLNAAFIGAAMLSIAAIFTAFIQYAYLERQHKLERGVRWFFLGWGGMWWFAAGIVECARTFPGALQLSASNSQEHYFVLFAAVSTAVITMVAKWLRWTEGALIGLMLLPLMIVTLIVLDQYWHVTTTFTDLGWLAWPLAIAALVWHLRSFSGYVAVASLWHAASWWFVTLFVAWNAVALMQGVLPDSVWAWVLWGAVPLVVVALLPKAAHTTVWPMAQFGASYVGWGWVAMLGALLFWVLLSGVLPGDPAPLPYVVIANPLELVQLGVLLVAYLWIQRLENSRTAELARPAQVVLASLAFVWLNLTAARAVHAYAGVSYPIDHVLTSDTFQSTASILWTVTALILMGLATRRASRWLWIVGASLLGLVILKLFTLDLSNLGTLARIVSFLSVGVLMLVIGYFAPMPPAGAREEDNAGSPDSTAGSPGSKEANV